MFKLTKISIELAVLLILTGFVFLYVILTRYFALLLLGSAIFIVYKVAKHYHDNQKIADRAVAIYKQKQASCVKVLPNPPDNIIKIQYPPLPTLEQQVEKFRQELNQD